MRKIFGAALLAAILASGSANAGVIYSNFGAGNSYSCCIGYTISGSTSQGGEFTSPGNYDVNQIDLGLTNVLGGNSAVVNLWTESGGLPNSLLGSWNVSGQPGFGAVSNVLTTIGGISGISLTLGSNYFLTVAPGAADTWDAWNWNTIGEAGTIVANGGSGWSAFPDSTLPAFDVLGNQSSNVRVPEPGTLLLLLTAFAGLGTMRSRKAKA